MAAVCETPPQLYDTAILSILQDSEYVLLRTEAVVRVPKELDPAATAPLLCAGVTVFNGMRQMRITPGGIVAIQGLGGLGHLALQYANKMGYEVVALSSSASKADFAKKLGASHYVDGSKEDAVAKLKSMGGADMIVCTAPSPQIIGPLTAGLAPGGKLLILSRKSFCSITFQIVGENLTLFSLWRCQYQHPFSYFARHFC